jgi:hypothetical protein
MLESLIIGVHIGSVHLPTKDYYRDNNAGIYARYERVQAGYYRNSYERDTGYLAYTVATWTGIDLQAGAAYGYQRKSTGSQTTGFARGAITPFVAFGYTAPKVFGVSPRLSVIPGSPKHSTVLHLSLEF